MLIFTVSADVWTAVFPLLKIADFTNLGISCKFFHDIITNPDSTNQFWKFQCGIILNTKPFPRNSTQNWFAFYQRLKSILTTLEPSNKMNSIPNAKPYLYQKPKIITQPESLQAQLCIACRDGKINDVKQLLDTDKSNSFSNWRNNDSNPLLIACYFGHIDIIKFLLKSKLNVFDVNSVDIEHECMTPLHIASQNGFDKIVELLLSYNADVNKRTFSLLHTPLWIASFYGHRDVVHELLQGSQDIIMDCKDANGITPLFIACQNNHENIVELLLQTRLFSTGRDIPKGTVLNQLDASSMIIKRGSDANLTTNENGSGCTPLWIASKYGNYQCMQHLIRNRNCNLNKYYMCENTTPVHVACQYGMKASVDVLLAAGAKINIPSPGRISPLVLAAYYGYDDIVKVLLLSGARLTQVTGIGLNLFHCAIFKGHISVVKKLYQQLIRVKCINDAHSGKFLNSGDSINGWTPLHLACMFGHFEIVKYLIEICKVDIMKQDYNGKNSIQHASQNGFHDVAKWIANFNSGNSC